MDGARPFLAANGRAVVQGKSVVVESERGALFFEGANISRLLLLLDGVRTVSELERELPGVAVRGMLEDLDRAGHVCLAGELCERERSLICTKAPLGSVAIEYVGIESETADRFSDALARLQIQCEDTEALAVVLTDDYLSPELAAVNLRRRSRPWLPAQIAGGTILIGPLLGRGKGTCWECIAHRMRLRSPLRDWMNRQRHSVEPLTRGRILNVGAELTAVEVLRILSNVPGSGERLIRFDLSTMTASQHLAPRRGNCSACGDPAEKHRSTRIDLRSSVPGLARPGGLRVAAAETTLARLSSIVDDVVGVVGVPRAVESTQDEFIFSYIAEHAFARPRDTISSLRNRLVLRSGGKGVTENEARLSAICEGIERYCATAHGDEPAIRGCYEELAERAVHPSSILLFSERQFEMRDRTNANAAPNQRIPLPFDEKTIVDWRPAWSLTHERERLILASACLYGHPQTETLGFAYADSNGCAAGNCVEEAALQGLFELIERDAVAIWWFNRLRMPLVNVESFSSEYASKWTQRYGELGLKCWVLDLTHDLNVPVFAVVACGTRGEIIYGFGAHLDADIALLRAMTEVNQSLPLAMDPNVKSLLRGRSERWKAGARIEDLPWLTPSDSTATLRSAFGTVEPDIGVLLRQATGNVQSRGCEVLLIDHSRADVDFAVVKVIAPGLRHFWRRLAPGRLFDVPVELAKLERVAHEEDLNEWDIYF